LRSSARNGRCVLRKRAGFVLSRHWPVTVSGDAVGSTCVHNVEMSRPVVSPQRKAEEALDKRAVRHENPAARMFGSSLADVFSTPAYDCRAVGSDQKPEFAVTRLRSGPREMEKAPTYPPGSGNPDLCVPNSCGDRLVASPLQRQERWGYASNTVRHDVYRSELPHGNVGARPIRLFALLPLAGIP